MGESIGSPIAEGRALPTPSAFQLAPTLKSKSGPMLREELRRRPVILRLSKNHFGWEEFGDRSSFSFNAPENLKIIREGPVSSVE